MKKRKLWLGAVLLFLTNLLNLIMSVKITAWADEKHTGPLLREEVVLDVSLEEKIQLDELLSEERLYGAKPYSSNWEIYGNYYIYNQLSAEEKEYWDALNELCLSYLLYETDMPSTNGTFHTELIGSENLTGEQMGNIMWLFRYCNPQYYFLNHIVYHSTDDQYYGFGVYTAFAQGGQRMQATLAMENCIVEWQSEIAACGTEEEKVRRIHDLILDKVHYNEKIYQSNFNEDQEYSQSAYSVFCGDSTVCAGYSQAFALLCNGAGIDAFSVTSSSHQWNKVCINDSWYNMDCTWNDYKSNEMTYFCYARNDAALQDTVHEEEDFWREYLPICTLDAVPKGDGSEPGSLPKVSGQVETPVIFIKQTGESAIVTLEGVEGASIYYTVNGETPSSAATKSIRYNGSFVVDRVLTITAMAVKNGYLDSAATAEQVNPLESVLVEQDGRHYYYENGIMVVSKEVYVDGAWRWFDADGTMAVNKDVYQTSSGGKWVRYNENGEMIKGEDYRYGGWYYFEPITGAMMKGPVILEDGRRVFYDTTTGQMLTGYQTIGSETYFFDESDGRLLNGKQDSFWITADGKEFWYENWQRQGWNPEDGSYRGKEIYDPVSDAWYWLDQVQHGAKAVSKDVYQESCAGPYADRDDGTGKWVRYDETGRMIKGWHQNENGTYYFDLIYGSMAKGNVIIDGISYYFDEATGGLR